MNNLALVYLDEGKYVQAEAIRSQTPSGASWVPSIPTHCLP